MKDITLHPCFNEKAKHTQARVHLPIAPKCNIQCAYCNRKYDCVNESRPGVTSTVLSPMLSPLFQMSKTVINNRNLSETLGILLKIMTT